MLTAEEFGRFIYRERKRSGLSQAALASKSGLFGQHISMVERIEHKRGPSLCTCAKLCEALGYSLVIIKKQAEDGHAARDVPDSQ